MGREKGLGCPARKENLKKKSGKSSRRGMGREKRSGMPRQEGKTSRKSQGRAVDGA